MNWSQLGTEREAANAAIDPTSLPAYRAVADYLLAKDPNP